MLKNEAETLQATLNSLIPLRKIINLQIVAGVDRKSNDETYNIIKEHADVLFEFDFNDNFSEIRNQLIERSGGEWILISDGHEIWHDINKIAEILLKVPPGIDAIAFKLRMNPEEGGTVGQQLRLFRNIEKVRYEGHVHNRLNIDTSGSLATDLVWIYHDRAQKVRGERYRQRRKMLEERFIETLKVNPDDARANYYLGTYYLSEAGTKDENGSIIKQNEKIDKSKIDVSKVKKALKYLNHYISVSDFYEEIYLAKWYVAQCHYVLGDVEKTKDVALDMFDQMLEMPFAQHVLGEIYLDKYKETKQQRMLTQSEFWFKNSINKKTPFVSCFFPEAFFTWLPYERLAEIYSIAANNQPERIKDAIFTAEKTLSFNDFPETRKPALKHCLMQWKHIRGDYANTDCSRSRDREFDRVNTINISNSESF